MLSWILDIYSVKNLLGLGALSCRIYAYLYSMECMGLAYALYTCVSIAYLRAVTYMPICNYGRYGPLYTFYDFMYQQLRPCMSMYMLLECMYLRNTFEARQIHRSSTSKLISTYMKWMTTHSVVRNILMLESIYVFTLCRFIVIYPTSDLLRSHLKPIDHWKVMNVVFSISFLLSWNSMDKFA